MTNVNMDVHGVDGHGDKTGHRYEVRTSGISFVGQGTLSRWVPCSTPDTLWTMQ